MLKSLFDRSIALIAIAILFVPVFIPVWLLIRCTSRGGAVYSQERVGLGCNSFRLYKFRSMYSGSDTQGFQTNPGDKRITPVGHFLRKTSIDELPQLFNVLKGDMSLVGPRPDTPAQRQSYTESDWVLRHSVRPGITGLAQVHGRSRPTLQERLSYDLEYVRNASFALDLSIIAQTLSAVLRQDST